MIQPMKVAPDSISILPNPAIANGTKNGEQSVNFNDLLAEMAAGPQESSTPAQSTLASSEPVMTGTSNPAETGNNLPQDLPVAVEFRTGSLREVAVPGTDRKVPAVRHFKANAVHVKPDGEQAAEQSTAEADTPFADAISTKPTETPPVSEVIAIKVADPAPVMPPPEAKADPTTSLEPSLSSQGPAHRTVPVLPDQASEQAEARMDLHRSQTAVPTPAPAAHPVWSQQAASPASLPRMANLAPHIRPAQSVIMPAAPAEAVRLAITLPQTTQAIGKREEGSLASPDLTPMAFSPSHFPDSQTLAVPTLAQAVPVRPHEFTALIDRLSAAREAMAPQAVSISVAHHEFGPVRLHFRTDDAGLAVTMTSPDPDFSRAAASAPILPVAASDQAGSALQQRSEGAATQHGGFAQSRGQHSGRREEQDRPQPHARSEPHRPGDNETSRSGIFA